MTRILILSDIHANLTALDAALSDAQRRGGFDEVWSLGDSVGYGPQPNECVSRLRETGALSIVGNHELAALGDISILDFNPYAAAAATWTADALSGETADYLRSLPRQVETHGFTLVHGSPRDPVWEYILDEQVAAASASLMDTALCAFGHTHLPSVFHVQEGGDVSVEVPRDGNHITLHGDGKWLVNPGSVGQPRDGDPRAAYALMDTDSLTVTFHRAGYDIAMTQALIVEAGLPGILATRLSHGQ